MQSQRVIRPFWVTLCNGGYRGHARRGHARGPWALWTGTRKSK